MFLFHACIAVIVALTVFGCASSGSYHDNLLGSDFRDIVSKAKDDVFPAVIFIRGLRRDMRRGEEITSAVSGSGVIISADGEVLTNWHVVHNTSGIRCLLYDGRAFNAHLIGSDKDTDLALLKLELKAGEPPLPIAEISKNIVVDDGDFVMAMGAPWGMNRSVSIGIISCSRRFLPEHSQYSLWYQTDAAISPGNSGGPLVNTDGYVIGINSRGIMQGGDMGFAVPASTIIKVVPRLRQYHRVNWAWTGLQLQPLKDFNKNISFDYPDGVLVAGTEPDSPAYDAGIRPHDRIVAINDIPITGATEEDIPEIRSIIGLLPFNQPATFKIVRNEQPLELTLTPREKGKVEGEELAFPGWDFSAKSINQFDNPELYFYRRQGVFIYGIKVPGNAARVGLMPKDIILQINNHDVNSLEDLTTFYGNIMQNSKNKTKLLFTLLRNGLRRQTVLDFSRDYDSE